MQFEALDQEKRERIINAGMEFFGKYGYKHANTEEIAHKAGISKGLLFYYFKNKQSFYLYLLDYCEVIVANYVNHEVVEEIDDFFDLLHFGAESKIKLLKQYPYVMEFIMQVWFSSQEGGLDLVKDRISNILTSTYQTWFTHLDFTRFKEDVDPMEIYQMLIWMMEGYLYDLRLMQKPLDIEAMMKEFYKWEGRLPIKRNIYNEIFKVKNKTISAKYDII